jgi:hypothetical protein
MTTKGYPVPPPMLADEKQHRRMIAECLQNMAQGKLNCVTQVTLAANATSTTLVDNRIGATTGLFFSALTADAAAALGGLYVSAQKAGQATLTHANTASIDRTFNVLLVG